MIEAGRIGIYGGSGSGKTTRARAMIARRSRVVVLDPLDEYGGAGFRRVTTMRAVLQALKAGWARGFRITYVPPAGHEAKALHLLSVLLRRAQAPASERRIVTLVAEELNLSFPIQQLPAALSGFADLCSRGRHYGVELIGVSQRIAEVHTRFRGNTGIAYYFRQDDHRDITTATQRLGPRWRAALMALKTHQYLRLCEGSVTQGRNAVPARARKTRRA